MNCAEFARVFYADLARGCDAEARAAADRHAAGCAGCAQKLAQQGALASAMGVDAPRARRARSAARARARSAAVFALVVVAAASAIIERRALPRLLAFAAQRDAPSGALVASASGASIVIPPDAPGAPIAAESIARARDASARGASASPPSGPRGETPTFDAAMHLYRVGRFDAAVAAFQAITPPTIEAAMWAARSVRASGDFGGAALLFGEIAAANTRTSAGDDAQLEVGRCYRALGQVDRARDWLRPLRGSATHAARAQEELDGIDRDLGLARERAHRAKQPVQNVLPVVAPRGIAPTAGPWSSRRHGAD